MIDEDGSGAIDVDEMRTAFNFLGVAMSQKEVEEMFAEVDEDGSGEIEFDEFIEVDVPPSIASAHPHLTAACALGDLSLRICETGSHAVSVRERKLSCVGSTQLRLAQTVVWLAPNNRFPGCLSMPDAALVPPSAAKVGDAHA